MTDRARALAQGLQGCQVGRELLVLDCVDSTNTEAKRRAAQGAADGLVILSRCQTAGRGRAGRSFQSPKDRGLYLTALLRPKLPPEAVVSFTAWTAVAVCDGIQAACGVRPRIKWTNDLVLNGKKLCGILTELGLDRQTGALDWLAVGVGVNVNHAPEEFLPDVRPIATSLAQELGRPVDLDGLTVQIVRALDRMYAAFPHEKVRYLEQYRADCLTVGQPVRLITPASSQDAFAVGIDDQFRLLVEYPDGTSAALSTGEASVRGLYGYV